MAESISKRGLYGCPSFLIPLGVCVFWLLLASPVLAGEPAAENQALIDQAAQLKSQGKFDEAIQALSTVIARGQADPAGAALALCRLGECYVAMNMPEKARVELEKVAATYPQETVYVNWARIVTMNALVNGWRLNDAIALCQPVLTDHAAGKATDKQAAWALIWKGRALMAQKRFAEARDPLHMAASWAESKDLPELGYEASFALGEACRKAGDATKDRDESGRLHMQALEAYRDAFDFAEAGKLGGDKLDYARLQLASEMRHLGMRDKAVAWLRMGIEDPAKLSETDKLLVERLASFLEPAGAEAWYQYLVDPATRPDPTQAAVQAELKTTPSKPSVPAPENTFQRLYWLARLYETQERLQLAAETYSAACGSTESSAARVGALSRMARCYWLLSVCGAGDCVTWSARAVQAASDILPHALAVVRNDAASEAHGAIEATVTTSIRVMRCADALTSAEACLDEAEHTGDASKIAFATYMRVQALAANGRYAAAALATEALYARFGTSQQSDVQEICAFALTQGIECYRRAGDSTAAWRLLGELEVRWSGRFSPEIGECKRRLGKR